LQQLHATTLQLSIVHHVQKKGPIHFPSSSQKVFRSLRLFAHILLSYRLIQQHSRGSPLLHQVNTLPCETEWCKIMAEQCGYQGVFCTDSKMFK